MPLHMLRALHPRLLYPHGSACFCFWVLHVGRPPSTLPAMHQYRLPCPVLLLAEGLGNKPDVPSTAEGSQWGPPITQGQMSCCQLCCCQLCCCQLCCLKARSWVCASACSHMTAELQVMQNLECAGACSLRGCVTEEIQGRADPRPLCDSSVAEII